MPNRRRDAEMSENGKGTPMTEAELAAIEERCGRARPAPWVWYHPAEYPDDIRLGWGGKHPRGGYLARLTHSHSRQFSGGAGGAHDDPRDEDAAFIAHAREDVPALVAELRRVRLEVAAAVADIIDDARALRDGPASRIVRRAMRLAAAVDCRGEEVRRANARATRKGRDRGGQG
jgi:hypothetical protein